MDTIRDFLTVCLSKAKWKSFLYFFWAKDIFSLQVQEDHEYNREHTLKIRLRPKPWAICFDDGGEIGPWNYAG